VRARRVAVVATTPMRMKSAVVQAAFMIIR
jgi:hypothetical protein